MGACFSIKEGRMEPRVQPAMEELIIRVDGLASRLGRAWPLRIMEFYHSTQGMGAGRAEELLKGMFGGEMVEVLKERVAGSAVYQNTLLVGCDWRGEGDSVWYQIRVGEWQPREMMEFLLQEDTGLRIFKIPGEVAEFLRGLWYLVTEDAVFKFSFQEGLVRAMVFPIGSGKGEYQVRVMVVEE